MLTHASTQQAIVKKPHSYSTATLLTLSSTEYTYEEPNYVDIENQLKLWFQKRTEIENHRQLLVVSGHKQWIDDNINLIIELMTPNTLWVGKTKAKFKCIEIKNYRSELGCEYDNVILDCFEGFRANAALALSGTIKANGLMIILCPNFNDWPTFPDPENINRVSHGYQVNHIRSQFYEYMTSAFLNDPTVAIFTPETFRGSIKPHNVQTSENRLEEQQAAVLQICKCALGRANRPLLLTADRGRGKSSALGIASSQLMLQKDIKILVTAPIQGNTNQIFSHAKALLPNDTKISKAELTVKASSLRYVPIDQLLTNNQSADLLLVDEAAAIPIHILIKLLERYPRIIFSSTTHGYEGSGRGFEIKFTELLKIQKPNYRRVRLDQPIRWHRNDVLEAFWFNTMLYNQQELQERQSSSVEVKCRIVNNTELCKSPTLLKEVFGLLLNAHYQTSPDDLHRLLDAPEQICIVLEKGEHIIAVALIIVEGGQTLELIKEDIADCSRRVKGHLVCQQLVSQYNISNLASVNQWRISRIAVNENNRRLGFGNTLLQYIEKEALNNDIKLLTAAFGANVELIKFWQKANFDFVQVGHKPEPSSGEHSCICIRPLDATGKTINSIVKTLSSEFADDFRFNLNSTLQILSTDLALALFSTIKPTSVIFNRDKVKQFINGSRAYLSCRRDIYNALSSRFNKCNFNNSDDAKFLVALLFQNRTYDYLCKNFNLNGKKQIEERLRVTIKHLLT